MSQCLRRKPQIMQDMCWWPIYRWSRKWNVWQFKGWATKQTRQAALRAAKIPQL